MNDIYENQHLVQFYANGHCKQCLGRGTRTHSLPNGVGQWVERRTLCPCVKRAVQKEAKELAAQTDG